MGVSSMLLLSSLSYGRAFAQDNFYATLTNQNLSLHVGVGKNVGGCIDLRTTSANITDPNNVLLLGPYLPAPLTTVAIEAPDGTTIPVNGTHLYIRVDGGRGHGGYDYIWGRITDLDPTKSKVGYWIQTPTLLGSHIVAKWAPLPVLLPTTGTGGGTGGGGGGGGGGGTTTTVGYDPQIEVDLIATIIHDQVRFQFTVINNGLGRQRSVALAFTQDDEIIVDSSNGIRTNGSPYIRKEVVLQGASIPKSWEAYIPNKTTPTIYSSIRSLLRPTNPLQNDPTAPTRFAVGSIFDLNAAATATPLYAGRNFDDLWFFNPVAPRAITGVNGIPAITSVIWDARLISAGEKVDYINYVGQATSDIDASAPVSLAVTGPKTLGYTVTKDSNQVVTGCAASPIGGFTVDAFVQNLTDTGDIGITISPVTLFLDLPKGLILANGETNPKTVLNLIPGGEGAASWKVMLDPANPVSGSLIYTVTASPNLGSGKSIQRSIEVPIPSTVVLKNNATTQGLYTMLSFPFTFGNSPPSTVLGLSALQPSPDFDLVRWNPLTGHYEPVNTFVPGLAYWFRNRLAQDKQVTINCAQYPPLANQVQPSSIGYRVDYAKGWNQIANPDLFGITASEILVVDPADGKPIDLATASDQFHQWILPVLFRYDTSDPNPQNWGYVIQDNLGFTMKPYEGYWLYVRKAGLQFFYPGVDTPGAIVTRAALAGAGLGVRQTVASANNWRLQLKAKGTVSTDSSTYIGVNSKASDNFDYYKIAKPPTLNNQTSLDIVHPNWTESGRYAMDLRSSAVGKKSWDLQLTSATANESVTVTWPEIANSVPKNYRLTLIDTDSNQRYDLRSTASVSLTTNANKTRNVQIVAEPGRGASPAFITSFDVVQDRSSGRASSSIAINYSLSESAEARVYIRNSSGRSVRTLAGTTRASGDSNSGTVVWDARDDKGTSIPAGTYSVELVAKGTNGQPYRQIKPFLLTR